MAVLETAVLVALLTNVVQAVDMTVVEGAVGTNVVIATIAKIEAAQVFDSDRRLLRRIAYVETRDGESPPGGEGDDYGGMWHVSRADFERTQQDEKLADTRKEIEEKFQEIEVWDMVKWEELDKPLWSALAARLVILLAELNSMTDIPTSSDVKEQGVFWKDHYNKAGDVDRFQTDVETLTGSEICKITSDVIFVLDSSGSINYDVNGIYKNNYETVRNFTYEFVDGLSIGPDENQIGVIIFGNEGHVVFNLSTFTEKAPLLERIRRIPYLGQYTNTADGLCLLLEEGFTEDSGARLSSDNVFHLAIVLTDGYSNRESQRCNWTTLEAAEAVHNFTHPIIVYAIGVTNNVNDEELRAIATEEEYIVYLEDFNPTLFTQTSDEQTYQLCFRSSIPVIVGQERSGNLEQGQSVRYEYPVPPEGLTVRLCVQQGYIVFYASFTVPNPNSALFDYKREVISLGTINCDDVFVNPSEENATPIRKRQSDDGQVSVNYTLYVSLEGLSEQNSFRLETTEGDNTEEDESVNNLVIVMMVCIGIALLIVVITTVAVTYLCVWWGRKRQRNTTG